MLNSLLAHLFISTMVQCHNQYLNDRWSKKLEGLHCFKEITKRNFKIFEVSFSSGTAISCSMPVAPPMLIIEREHKHTVVHSSSTKYIVLCMRLQDD